MVERQTEQLQALSFVLRPTNDVPKPNTIHYHFQASLKPTEPSDSGAFAALPIFNSDKQFFTPAFILNIDHNYYRLNSIFEGQKFEEKIKQSKQQFQEQDLHLPFPSSDFCQVCRTNFKNYYEHCQSKSHLNTMRASKGNQYIDQLCKAIAKTTQNKRRKTIEQIPPNKALHTRKVKKKEKNKKTMNKNNNISRDGSTYSVRLPLTTQISFERE